MDIHFNGELKSIIFEPSSSKEIFVGLVGVLIRRKTTQTNRTRKGDTHSIELQLPILFMAKYIVRKRRVIGQRGELEEEKSQDVHMGAS